MENIIEVKNLKKIFKKPKKPAKKTIWNSFKSIFYRQWEIKKVLKGINFEIKKGEFIGYVGPNGAGKSTTIKMLTGILTPTSGSVKILNFNPNKDRYEYTKNIGVTFGQKSLLFYDIPVIESFKLYKAVYELDNVEFDKRIKTFSNMLKINHLLHVPVRKLSLGERMRCEIVASLLHKPKIVFLDEPTIGLDAIAKEEIRKFLKEINEKEGTTIILTTHDMADIEELCKRIILIDDGKIVYDGSLEKLKQRYIKYKQIEFKFEEIKNKEAVKELKELCKITKETDDYIRLQVNIQKHRIRNIIDKILLGYDIIDLTIHEEKLETIIKEIYRTKKIQ